MRPKSNFSFFNWTLGQMMKKILFTFLLLSTITANATSTSFTGNLANDDDVQLFNFTTNSLSDVTLRTWSYAGGTNANGDLISAGGFDPILALFDSLGNLIDQNDDGVGVANDPITGSGFDTLLTSSLAAGDYTVAVMQYSNFAFGPTLADGFEGSGVSGFDGRTSFWAFDISGVDTATVSSVPVPAAVWLFGSGLFGLIGMKKKSSNIPNLSA
jgi:hypothetical protein